MGKNNASSLNKWFDLLPTEVIDLADKLCSLVAKDREEGKIIFPTQENIFKALELTPPEKVKVVIIGQDPYFNSGQANGLAFSVNKGMAFPPSLKNIFKELQNDIGASAPSSGDLTPWSEQGVLLLNTVLTVEAGKPNSHSKRGWQNFTYEIFKVCAELPQPIAFMLWGAQARAFAERLYVSNSTHKLSLCSSHPSPLGARKGNDSVPAFIGSRPFSKANNWLLNSGTEPVNWILD